MGFLEHLKFGCWWDIPALILLIVITVLFFVRRHQLSKEKKELQGKLSQK